MSLSRSGRVIVYANEVPYETDVLYTNMYKMVDVSKLAQAVLGGTGTGNATLVSGLIAVPHSPANLTIDIGSGVIYTLAALDATAYSTIPADTSDFIYKPYTQVTNAFNQAGFTPPGSGTLNYLVQARGLTVDTDPASRPFFNPANPANPIFQTVNQTRYDGIEYLLTSAVSPAIPTPTAGYVGLYVVSVAAGQTSITAPNITVYSSAPFITESLTEKIGISTGDARYARPFQIQNSSFVYASTTGAANTYVISLSPAVTSLVSGLKIQALINVSNTGSSTLNVNGLGAISIISNISGATLFSNDLRAGRLAELIYNGTNFLLLNPLSATDLKYVGASMYMTAAQVVSTISPTYTILTFDTVISGYDPYSLANTSTNRITAPVNGFYMVNGQVVFTASTGAGSDLSISLNGVISPIKFKLGQNTYSGGGQTGISGASVIKLNSGDYIQLAMTLSGGTNTINTGTIDTKFDMYLLGFSS